MNPFWEIADVFGFLKLQCRSIAEAIWGTPLVPSILGDWFWAAYDWFFDVQLWFITAGWWYEDVVQNIQTFVTQDWVQAWLSDPLGQLALVWAWFLDRVRNISDVIDAWWSATWYDVRDWVYYQLGDLEDLISDVQSGLNRVDAWVDNFLSVTLPSLLSFDWFGSWWGNIGVSFSAWWSATWLDILDNINVAIAPLSQRIAQFDDWFDLLKQLIDDPEQWLLDRLESMIARFL